MTARVDPNNGPVSLDHDPTPKDMQAVGIARIGTELAYGKDVRFKGYPDTSMNAARVPVLGPAGYRDEHIRKHYGKGQHFIAGQPVEKGLYGVQYGSDNAGPNSTMTTPIPKRVMFPEFIEDKEIEKRHVQKKEAENDINRFKAEKQKKIQQEHEQKRKDWSDLLQYKPWGAPGAGAPAPGGNSRRTNKVQHMFEKAEEEYYPSFGRPGHGAPLRDSSGQVLTAMKANEDLRFQSNKTGKSDVENHVRYKQHISNARKYAEELDNMIIEKRTKKELEQYQDREADHVMLQHNPFGKPGAGAPIKTGSGRVLKGRPMTLVNDQVELRKIEQKQEIKNRQNSFIAEKPAPVNNESTEDVGLKFGGGQGAPQRKEDGYVVRHKNHTIHGVQETAIPDIRGGTLETKSHGGGGALVDESGKSKTRFKQTLKDEGPKGAVRSSVRGGGYNARLLTPPEGDESYHPWGKGGAGAPLKNSDGSIVRSVYGKLIQDQTSVPVRPPPDQEYLTELKREIQEQQHMRKEDVMDRKRAGGDVTSWVTSGQIGYPKKNLMTTAYNTPRYSRIVSDVTANKMDIRKYPKSKDYTTELQRQADERKQEIQKMKQEEGFLSHKHQSTMEDTWGRPGGGAPKGDNRKQTLDMERTAKKSPSFNHSSWTRTNIGSPINKNSWEKPKNLDKGVSQFSPVTYPNQRYHVKPPYATV